MLHLIKNKGFSVSGVFNLTPKEAFELCTLGATILDVREDYMNRFKMLDVKNIIFCPYSILPEQIPNLSSEKLLIIADSTGIKSKEAYRMLKENGYTEIANLAGGLVEWEREGLPVIIDKTERLSGSCMCQLKPRDRRKKR